MSGQKKKKINVIANMITHCLDIYLCLAIRMVVDLNITLIAAGVCEQAYTPADVTACHLSFCVRHERSEK